MYDLHSNDYLDGLQLIVFHQWTMILMKRRFPLHRLHVISYSFQIRYGVVLIVINMLNSIELQRTGGFAWAIQ